MKHKRLNKLPNSRVQGRIVGSFVAIGMFGLVLQFFLSMAALGRIHGLSPSALDAIQRELLSNLVLASLIVAPALIAVGAVTTFRITGPLFNIERFLGQLARGLDPGVCRLRQRDELQELGEIANQIADRYRATTVSVRQDPQPNEVSCSSESA